MEVRFLGRVSYADALGLQRRSREELLAGVAGELLLLLEHSPVLTVGRSGTRADLGLTEEEWARRGVEVAWVDRGGLATYHGPGQVVAYPIVDLRRRGRDVRAYVRSLEDAGAAAVARFRVGARPGRDPVGIFVGEAKIGSIGVSVWRWITQHGIALNVENDLEVYRWFKPCGLEGVPVTRLSDVAAVPVTVEEAGRALAEELRLRLDSSLS